MKRLIDVLSTNNVIRSWLTATFVIDKWASIPHSKSEVILVKNINKAEAKLWWSITPSVELYIKQWSIVFVNELIKITGLSIVLWGFSLVAAGSWVILRFLSFLGRPSVVLLTGLLKSDIIIYTTITCGVFECQLFTLLQNGSFVFREISWHRPSGFLLASNTFSPIHLLWTWLTPDDWHKL